MFFCAYLLDGFELWAKKKLRSLSEQKRMLLFLITKTYTIQIYTYYLKMQYVSY